MPVRIAMNNIFIPVKRGKSCVFLLCSDVGRKAFKRKYFDWKGL